MKLGAWPRLPFLGLVLAAMLGILVADAHPDPSIAVAIGAAVLGLLAGATRSSVLTHLFAAAAFFWLHSLQITDPPGLRLARQLGDQARPVTAIGFVVSEPKLGASEFSTFLFMLESIDFGGRRQPTNATLFVRWRGKPAFGEQLQISGMSEPVAPPRNPGEFDLRAYLARRDVHRQLFARYPENGVMLKETRGHHILRAAQHSRRWMERVLSRGLEDSADVQALVSGTVLGVRQQAPEDIEEAFQQTGTLHLFSVSGLHVAIVAQLLWTITRLARIRQTHAILIIIPTLLFYAAVTGLNTASVRAALMCCVVLGGMFVERRVFSLNSLAAVAFLILAWNTNELFSVGFQLSFAVVAAILLAGPPLFAFFRRWFQQDEFIPRQLFSRPRKALDWFLVSLAGGASVSLAAWLGSLPLVFSYYHLITPVSLFANLAVVPLAFCVLAAGLISLMVASLSAWLSIVFNNANWFFAKTMLAVVHFFAAIPGGHFYLAHPNVPARTVAEATILDLGAGGALHLRTARADWLIDAGGKREFERIMREYLRRSGINRLDGLILTHGDSKHIGAALRIIDDFRPRLLIDNPAPDKSGSHRELIQGLATRQKLRKLATAGEEWPISRRVRAKVLFPSVGHESSVADDQAMVVQVVIGEKTRILLMSDSGESTEEVLLASGADLRSDILVKGQHRSGLSGTTKFLDAVSPQLIIASSRVFPETERITQEWVDLVHLHGIKLFRQDETGAVQLRFFRDRWDARAYLSGEIFRSANR